MEIYPTETFYYFGQAQIFGLATIISTCGPSKRTCALSHISGPFTTFSCLSTLDIRKAGLCSQMDCGKSGLGKIESIIPWSLLRTLTVNKQCEENPLIVGESPRLLFLRPNASFQMHGFQLEKILHMYFLKFIVYTPIQITNTNLSKYR